MVNDELSMNSQKNDVISQQSGYVKYKVKTKSDNYNQGVGLLRTVKIYRANSRKQLPSKDKHDVSYIFLKQQILIVIYDFCHV